MDRYQYSFDDELRETENNTGSRFTRTYDVEVGKEYWQIENQGDFVIECLDWTT